MTRVLVHPQGEVKKHSLDTLIVYTTAWALFLLNADKIKGVPGGLWNTFLNFTGQKFLPFVTSLVSYIITLKITSLLIYG